MAFKKRFWIPLIAIFGAAVYALQPSEQLGEKGEKLTQAQQIEGMKKCVTNKRSWFFSSDYNYSDETSCKIMFPLAAQYCSSYPKILPGLVQPEIPVAINKLNCQFPIR